MLDFDQTDAFANPYYPVSDGGALDGSNDGQLYGTNSTDHWNLVFQHYPFSDVVLNYNGYDSTTNPVTPGVVPEFYCSSLLVGRPTTVVTNGISTLTEIPSSTALILTKMRTVCLIGGTKTKATTELLTSTM